MSHIVEGKSQITDIDCLRQAIQNLGLRLETGGRPRFYYDGREQAPECDYLVVLPGRYDLGFKRQADGTYSYVCDGELLTGAYGRGSEGRALIGENAEKLVNEYAWAAAQQEAALNNYTASRTVENGEQVIVLERYN